MEAINNYVYSLKYASKEIQDNADSASIYSTLENKIIPAYYNNKQNKSSGISHFLNY